MWGLEHAEHIEFYREMEQRGKDTPLDDYPELNIIQSYYLKVITRLRKMASPITIQDLFAYYSLFPTLDKERLLEVACAVNVAERANV